MALGFGLQDQLLKLPARKKLEKLTENAAKSIHGRVLLVRLFDKTESYEVDPTSLMANLDKSAYQRVPEGSRRYKDAQQKAARMDRN